MPYFIKKHYQPLLAGALLLVGLLVFGVIQLVNSGTSQAERLKNLGDRYYNSHNVERAIQHYEWALEADAGFEEVYFLLFDIYTKQGNRDKVRDVSLRGVEHIRAEHERFTEIYKAATDYIVEFLHYLDPLENILRYIIDKPNGNIWRSDLDVITELTIPATERTFASLIDFTHLKDLQYLSIFVRSENLSNLAHMDKLTELHLNRNNRGAYGVNISALSELTGLEVLTLRNCGITDLSPLAELTNLTHLDLRNNLITDISPLTGLDNLDYLDLTGNPITDFSPLDNMRIMEVYYDNPGIN
jgi:tetratricopeptide (TPR) repeat protein